MRRGRKGAESQCLGKLRDSILQERKGSRGASLSPENSENKRSFLR